jgi:hypothetical protein
LCFCLGRPGPHPIYASHIAKMIGVCC